MRLSITAVIVRHLPRSLLFAAALVLMSCAGPGYKPPGDTTVLSLDGQNVEDLLAEAALSPSPQKEQLHVNAAALLWQKEKYKKAITLLMDIDANQLTGRHLAIYSLLYGRWTVDNQQWVLSETLLDTEQLADALTELEPELAILLHELRAEYFEIRQQPVNAVQELQALAVLLMDPEAKANNTNRLWHILRKLSENELLQLQRGSGQQLAAWAELALIVSTSQHDLDHQVALLDSWLQQWPRHPAALELPREMQLLQQAIANRPQHITLLLPLSGSLQKAGEALRDGFFAAYFDDMAKGKPLPQVALVNSQHSEEFLALYKAASRDTDLIIGPLNKDYVKLLAAKNSLPVATLALNYLENSSDGPDKLFQFGLNPEDEARQAAQLMQQQQYQQALIISPNTSWGERVSNAFITEWHKLGGAVSGKASYNPETEDYSNVIQQALGISDSKVRYRWLRQFAAGKLEFEPRRRQDIDVIFLAAQPKEARQIKPLLAFHYAGQIPVYATSSIYSGREEPEKNTDLDGVLFSAMPWLFTNSQLKRQIDVALNPNPSYQFLYAMGADTWRLHARLSLLAGSPDSKLTGNTGTLHLNEQQQVSRQQLWAIMRRGQVKILPSMSY